METWLDRQMDKIETIGSSNFTRDQKYKRACKIYFKLYFWHDLHVLNVVAALIVHAKDMNAYILK